MANQKQNPVCIRCGHVGGEKDKYCVSCGAPLHNTCGDEPGLLTKGCRFINEPHAAFCSRCGHPTRFHMEGLVSSSQPVSFPMSLGKK